MYVCICLGSWHQRQNPDPCHGLPLWGGHAGYSPGVCQELWKVPVHSHQCKCPSIRFIVSTISRMGFIRKNDRGNCSIKFSHSLFHRAIRLETTRNSSWSSAGAVTENNRVITGMLCSINGRFLLHLMHYTQATRLHATPVLLLQRLPDVWMQSVLFAGFARWMSIAKMLEICYKFATLKFINLYF